MQYASPGAFRTGLEARLLRQSRETSTALGRLRRRVVFERLLARLARSSDAGWVLKGGMALEVRMGDRARVTRDLDLGLRGVPENAEGEWIRTILAEALATDPDNDWFEFRIQGDRPIMPKEIAQDGWRFHVQAMLAGKTFERVRIDIVPGFTETAGTERLRLPRVLGFAGIEPVEIDAIDLRGHFAEKMHALTRPRIRPSSRVKDLADLILLIDEGLGADADLLAVTERVFAEAATHEIQAKIAEPPDFWQELYGLLAADLELSATTLAEATAKLQTFWSQVLAASTT